MRPAGPGLESGPAADRVSRPEGATLSQLRTINGVAVSPGLALGPVHVVRAAAHVVPTWSVGSHRVEHEVERLHRALESTGDELERRQRIVAAETSEADAQIFAVHRMILKDPGALGEVERTIRDEGINAESAVQKLIKKLESTLGRMEGESVRSFATDLADPWRNVLDVLMRGERQAFLATEEKVVLAAGELTPQVLTCLARDRLLGVITQTGGRYSHGAVLARAFGVPCVTGLPGLLGRLEQGMIVSIDGGRGRVQLRPGEEDIEAFEAERQGLENRMQELVREAGEPSITPDGHAFGVHLNIESLLDLDTFDPSHTDGLGLVRTEFLYMERPQFPSEDEQFRLYRRVLERMKGRPAVFRTLDIGGDKRLPYFQTPEETNPVLGWRGLRILLEWQDLLRVQLRAALRAGFGHDLRILLPMVTSLEEVLAVRDIFLGVRDSLYSQGYEIEDDVPVGIMIEVPSVLYSLSELVKHVDFLSVGTNDLVQYLLAVDRDNPWVAKLYEPRHPAVMAALAHVARVANEAGLPVSVCGDMADDPAVALLLFGMGYDAVSVAPPFLAEIKYAVRRTRLENARELVRDVLRCPDVAGVTGVLSAFRERLHGS